MEILRKIAMLFVTFFLLRFNLIYGNLDCEDLTMEECAFAVSSSGSRCVLEKSTLPNGEIMSNCQTSLIMADRAEEWIESNECIIGCGLERESYGMSTDALMELGFVDKLCSPECQNNCPNIVDLYLKLAAGEGVYLLHLCTQHKSRARLLIVDPMQAAQYGTEGSNMVSSTTHNHVININRKLSLPSQLVEQRDPSVALEGVPTPQASPIYGPSFSPTITPIFAPTTKSILTSSSPSIATLTQNPSPMSLPTFKVSTMSIHNDFDNDEY